MMRRLAIIFLVIFVLLTHTKAATQTTPPVTAQFEHRQSLSHHIKLNPGCDSLPPQGVKLIKEFEGFYADAYPDPLSGVPVTIGYGSTKDANGRPFTLGQKITLKQAEDLLILQLTRDYLPPLRRIPFWNEMNCNQRGALLSFGYNLGANFYGAKGFSKISDALKRHEWSRIKEVLIVYRNPGTNVEAGLLRRRIAEGNLFTTPI